MRVASAAVVLGALGCIVGGDASVEAQAMRVRFDEVSERAGVAVEHSYRRDPTDVFLQVSGGVASGDVDGDGWPDLFVIGGDGSRQYLFRNNRDGTFQETAVEAGIAFAGELLSGPVFGDIDGDRDLDLFIGVVPIGETPHPLLLTNDGNGRFVEVGRLTEMFPRGAYSSATFGDYDGDGVLDLFTAHWGLPVLLSDVDHLWRNDGTGRFAPATSDAGLEIATRDSGLIGPFVWSFTANFADLNSDGIVDLLVASDFETSQVFLGQGGGRFVDVSTDVLTDENGMGAAIGDFDNDGHLDWFVTSIYDPTRPSFDGWGVSGNRLYRNLGDGRFEDVTEEAGVRDGGWGWGACAADFDNDGLLDIFHVNGWLSNVTDEWSGYPARLFMNNGDGTFTEHAAEAGIADRGEGRGVVCFDFDRDGDVDVFIGNITGPTRLYENRIDGTAGYIQVKLVGRAPNTEGIGARVYLRASGATQMRELRAGSNFLSQDPAVAHFGIGSADGIDEIEVVWPGGGFTAIPNLGINRHWVVFEVAGDANCDSLPSAADLPALARAVSTGVTAAPCPGGDMNYDGRVDEGDMLATLTAIFRTSNDSDPVADSRERLRGPSPSAERIRR